MFELKVTDHFAAAHQLRMVAEKCENLHGHNWKVEAYVAGKQLNKAGVLVDFGEVKNHLSEIMNTLDHKYLNELDFLGGESFIGKYRLLHCYKTPEVLRRKRNSCLADCRLGIGKCMRNLYAGLIQCSDSFGIQENVRSARGIL